MRKNILLYVYFSDIFMRQKTGCFTLCECDATFLSATMPIDPEDIEEEQKHFATVVATFQQYGPYAVSA